jgi:hypothetical protein
MSLCFVYLQHTNNSKLTIRHLIEYDSSDLINSILTNPVNTIHVQQIRTQDVNFQEREPGRMAYSFKSQNEAFWADKKFRIRLISK